MSSEILIINKNLSSSPIPIPHQKIKTKKYINEFIYCDKIILTNRIRSVIFDKNNNIVQVNLYNNKGIKSYKIGNFYKFNHYKIKKIEIVGFQTHLIII